jgi:hypothetical protein
MKADSRRRIGQAERCRVSQEVDWFIPAFQYHEMSAESVVPGIKVWFAAHWLGILHLMRIPRLELRQMLSYCT